MEHTEGMLHFTSNFYLAAAFIASGLSLSSVDDADKKHIRFGVTAKTQDHIDEIQREWDNKLLQVNAREYADAIRELKMRIHQS